jgi:AraC family transcriptional regulator, regulatory protein of adaptative response / methylated-DNA-[protein]-cysteine methyltransferase
MKVDCQVLIDRDWAFAAFDARDRSKDGQFVGAVKTTGIYCKPSCPARRPKRENVEFFADGAAARAAGYRACKRCLPDNVARDDAAVAQAIALLSGSNPPRLAALAAAVGYAPSHFQRLFKRHLGVSPALYLRALRVERVQSSLAAGERITDAVYDAGYSAPSRFYADVKTR